MKHNSMLHEKNLADRHRRLQKILRTCREKQLQNYECQHQIELVDTKLMEQTRIADSQAAQDERSTSKRMKSVVTHKKLKEISKAQDGELRVLRAEVERLNLRTYPSFVDQATMLPDQNPNVLG